MKKKLPLEIFYFRNKKNKEMKKVLTFCEECGNIMVLKEKKGRSVGEYECRTCGLIKEMKLEKIEIKENNFQEETIKISQQLNKMFRY